MKSLLIKLSGELLSLPQENRSSSNVDFTKNLPIRSITQQIKTLSKKYFIGIVIGGGNFFRGNQHGKALGITGSARHHVGMLATMMNGVLLKDLLSQEEVNSETLSAIECPKIALQITEKNIKQAKEDKKVIIFVAGTGKPFFTTDTAAIMRAHQIGSTMVFKATKV
ncbi:hypothetical protein KAU11_05450, partial [Candidatus Babeliales bacterium]|nr:hypothetical protein [Candidatus Babeliales bacterium]